MHRFLTPFSIRSLSLRGAHALVALTLVFSLVAGLACDENAPTETRAPAHPIELAGGDEPDLAIGDITAQAIALPVDQSVATTAPAPAFRIRQTGTGPNGIFQINRTGNTQTALQGLTNGRGRAGLFQTTNTGNTRNALEARSNSTELVSALYAVNTGDGLANGGTFELTNSQSRGRALDAVTAGLGPAGVFHNTNTRSDIPTVTVFNTGVGHALEVVTISSFATQSTLRVGNTSNGARRAAEFIGDVVITGTLSKGAGSFRIDHPLDPEHKYLSHSFVESPDMMNVYNGNVTLDKSGRATVELPEYFEALNRDFRYQLTPIGAPGPNLYIAQGVKENRFRIAGGRPYASVSWQVTGVRQDVYANEHRIKVEEDKPRDEEKRGAERLVARR